MELHYYGAPFIIIVRTCLDFFATFLKKGSAKNFHREGFLWIYIVRSTIVSRKKVRSTVERTV